MVEAAVVVDHQTQVDLVDQVAAEAAVVKQEPQVKVIHHPYHLLKAQMVLVDQVMLGGRLDLQEAEVVQHK